MKTIILKYSLILSALFIFVLDVSAQNPKRLKNLFYEFKGLRSSIESLKTYNANRGWYLKEFKPEKDLSGEARLFHNLAFLQHRKNIDDFTARYVVSEVIYDSYLIVDNNFNLLKYKKEIKQLEKYYRIKWMSAQYGDIHDFNFGEQILWKESALQCGDLDLEDFEELIRLKDFSQFEPLQLYVCFCEKDEKVNDLIKLLLLSYQNHLLNNNVQAMEQIAQVMFDKSDLDNKQLREIGRKYISFAMVDSIYENIEAKYLQLKNENRKSPLRVTTIASLKEKIDTFNFLKASDYYSSTFVKIKKGTRFSTVLDLYQVPRQESVMIFKKVIDYNRVELMKKLGNKKKINGIKIDDKIPIKVLVLPNFGQMGLMINPATRKKDEYDFVFKEKKKKSPNTFNQKK